MGGLLAANLAAVAAKEGLPTPVAVMPVEPGKTWGPRRTTATLSDLKGIPAGTLLLTVVGDRDRIASNIDARRIYKESVNVSAADKNYVVMQSDEHGTPPLIANHAAPAASEKFGTAEGGVDALDYYGTWKLFDALFDAAFNNKDRDIALGNTAAQKFMGVWSDGVPIKPLQVIVP